MINEINVECFLCVAKTLNFTKASKELYISQQAVSKHIANLEEYLGHKLFVRTPINVELTFAGETFFDFFSNVAKQYSLIQYDLLEAKLDASNPPAAIHIGYQNWMDFGQAPVKAMTGLRNDYPEIILISERHSPSELLRRLKEGNLDIILIHKRFLGDDSQIDYAPLFETEMIVAASEENHLATEGATYKSFKNEPLLMDSLEGESNDNTIRRAQAECKRFGFVPRNIIVLPNRDSIYSEAESNRGVFFGSSNAQLPSLLKIKKYPADTFETICCAWQKSTENAFLIKYINILKDTYSATED